MKLFKVLLLLLFSSSLFPTTIIYVPLQESFQLSEFILKGEVLETYPFFDFEGQLNTKVVLLVEESLKGDIPIGSKFEFEVWGGKFGKYNVETVGEAQYEVGEKILVQLESINGAYHTLGLSFGKWNVKKDLDGFEYLERDLSDLGMVNVLEKPITKIKYEDFKKFLKNKEEVK